MINDLLLGFLGDYTNVPAQGVGTNINQVSDRTGYTSVGELVGECEDVGGMQPSVLDGGKG